MNKISKKKQKEIFEAGERHMVLIHLQRKLEEFSNLCEVVKPAWFKRNLNRFQKLSNSLSRECDYLFNRYCYVAEKKVKVNWYD